MSIVSVFLASKYISGIMALNEVSNSSVIHMFLGSSPVGEMIHGTTMNGGLLYHHLLFISSFSRGLRKPLKLTQLPISF